MPGYPCTEGMSVQPQQEAREAHGAWLLEGRRQATRIHTSDKPALFTYRVYHEVLRCVEEASLVLSKESVVGFLWSTLPMTHLELLPPPSRAEDSEAHGGGGL